MKGKRVYKDIVCKMLFLKLFKIGIAITALCYAWSAYDCVASSNACNARYPYQTVYVNHGDTVWSIAARHTGERDDIRTTVMAIKQLNRLPHDVTIYAGQALKVPQQSGKP